jgi:transcriptional regulator of acetoin/glycerol metabolism
VCSSDLGRLASEASRPRPGSHGLTAADIDAALAKAGGNRAQAARLLRIDRRTLYRNMARLGLG